MNTSSFLAISQKILHAYNKLCEPLLAEYDIPQVSFDILMFLTNNPKYVTAQEISEMRHIKKNLVSVHVDKLVSAGFLKRSSIADDRRKIALSCTEKAKPIIQAGHKLQENFYSTLTAGIDDSMWSVFNKINATLEINAELILKS
ncbi:MAG TPA: MarR family winged helix-turn-helix transcriptional regulator [Methanocorpusculum sp.]|nr:MarR family winged helix-turn-helix transcriptional regulator [Methanocorpusculum sp.]